MWKFPSLGALKSRKGFGFSLFFIFIFFNFIFIDHSCFTMLCWFLLSSKWISCVYTCIPSFFGFPSHLGRHRALSRILCATQSVLISYLYISSILPIPPTRFPPLGVHMFAFYVCVYFWFANKFINAILLEFHIYALIFDICFSLLIYFTLYGIFFNLLFPTALGTASCCG